MAGRQWMFALGATALVWVLFTGCTSTAAGSDGADPGGDDRASVGFTTVVEGAASGGSGTKPSLSAARNDRQITALLDRLSGPDRPLVESVDLTRHVVLAVFLGVRPTSGYGIEVRAVKISEPLLEVVVRRERPGPGDNVRPGFETPYAVVRVTRKDFLAHRPQRYLIEDLSGLILARGPIV